MTSFLVFIVAFSASIHSSKAVDSCLELTCTLQCTSGFVYDANDCKICQCMDPCDNVICPADSYCEVPTCITAPCNPECTKCAPVLCEMFCPNGFDTDVNGCEICKCRECEELLCDSYCPHGHVKDKYGCDTCNCNPDPCDGVECPVGKQCYPCTSPTCSTKYQCECGLACSTVCRYGNAMNTAGCPTCSCCDRPGKGCRRKCPTGYIKSPDGCTTCECKPKTCEGMTCPSDQTCKMVDVWCVKQPCISPIPMCVEKKLVCPSAKGMLGLCVELCSSTQPCTEDGQLCCSNGCGHSCQTGILV
ncbi:unnamed protein product [Owenia fusiformis]|uniref:Uncharacterized protein n=1 Tax=Owenia fusiformis TaxID=6347 RepID=A0A8J1URR6_OWEFU|nr:unnamed protein product [Owenia fusiformis]